jgi:hypothetical protein
MHYKQGLTIMILQGHLLHICYGIALPLIKIMDWPAEEARRAGGKYETKLGLAK